MKRNDFFLFSIFLFLKKIFFETLFLCSFGTYLELALVDLVGLELTEICLPLSPECWD